MNNKTSDTETNIFSKHKKLFTALLMLLVGLGSIFISIDHYSDGGCDGGLCALAFVYHALPLLVSWVTLIIGFLFYPRFAIVGLVFTTVSILINAQVANLDYSAAEGAMLQPVFLLFVAQGLMIYTGIMALIQHKEK